MTASTRKTTPMIGARTTAKASAAPAKKGSEAAMAIGFMRLSCASWFPRAGIRQREHEARHLARIEAERMRRGDGALRQAFDGGGAERWIDGRRRFGDEGAASTERDKDALALERGVGT